MFWQTSPCNFWSALYTITEICTIVWRRHTNTLLKFWNVSIRLTWLTIASNVLNRSFLAFHRGKLWQKNDFCQFFAVLHKITYDCTTKLHGPSHQISKKTKHGKLYINRSSWKMLQNVEKSLALKKNFWGRASVQNLYGCWRISGPWPTNSKQREPTHIPRSLYCERAYASLIQRRFAAG